MITLNNPELGIEDKEILQLFANKNIGQYSQGNLVREFETKFAKHIGYDYCTFVNSGSSANLLTLYALICNKTLSVGDYVAVSALSWSTTIAPIIQLGLKPVVIDVDMDTLGININELEMFANGGLKIKALVLVHALGIPAKLNDIRQMCCKYGIILIEDCCEALGSKHESSFVGTFGEINFFSFYASHQLSTIEGGMICTNNPELNKIIRMLRAHGWARDLTQLEQNELKEKYTISDFDSKFTFYVPGFNVRSTEINAYFGLTRLDTINTVCMKRYYNFLTYNVGIKNEYWKPKTDDVVSSFAYPLVTPKREKVINVLEKNNIETRPIICGSITRQPFYIELFGKRNMQNADIIYNYGMYLPNHEGLSEDDIIGICKIVNEVINEN